MANNKEKESVIKIKDLECPPGQEKCEKNPIKFQTSYAMTSALAMIMSGVIGGLAVGIAIILQQPIGTLITELNWTTDPTIISLLTILVYFIVAVLIIIIIIIPVNKKMAKIKEVAAYNKMVL